MKTILEFIGSIWCLIIHGIFLLKHDIIDTPDDMEEDMCGSILMKCRVCGRLWKM